MIDLQSFNRRLQQFKKVNKLDLSEAVKIGNRSVDEVKEFAGTWNTKLVNDKLKIQLKQTEEGGEASVYIPNKGYTWHTHPKGCPNINDCSIIPPSANDMQVFAERSDDQHLVITKKRVYWVKANRAYTKEEIDKIFDFYKILENYFDNSSIDHDDFDKIFTQASRFGNFFTIYKFKNKNINFT